MTKYSAIIRMIAGRSKAIVRRATRADIEAFLPVTDRPTVKAWVVDVDGRIVGMGGLALGQGRWIRFCDLSEEGRHYKRAIVKAGRAVMEEARRAGHRFIYAEADADEPMARRWLTRNGFRPDQTTRIYRWQA